MNGNIIYFGKLCAGCILIKLHSVHVHARYFATVAQAANVAVIACHTAFIMLGLVSCVIIGIELKKKKHSK